MNTFIDEFESRLDQVRSQDQLESLHDWIWDNKQNVARTASEINSSLRLTGSSELKRDLPCLTVGSTSGLVIVAGNPGWKPALNALEDVYCKRSKHAYRNLMFNFFHLHPIVRGGVYSKWWSKAMKFVALVPGQESWAQLKMDKPDRWAHIHASGILGGWDVFPWHSSKDAITRKVGKLPWLNDFCRASLGALLRMKPRVLFVASSAGYQLVRHDLLSDCDWIDFDLAGTKCGYTNTAGGTEIIAIKVQILGNGVRSFTDKQLIEKVKGIRSRGHDAANRSRTHVASSPVSVPGGALS
jgi:hypothetical protein